MSKKLLLFLVLGIILTGVFRLSSQRALSFHFVDEEDHIVTASLMNQGYKLYKDLSVNHQPLVYLGSSWLQKIAKPTNMLVLIKWHRLAIFFYSAIWSILLVWKFRKTGLLFVAMFEWLKFYLFGNLWLMESLAVYPTVYLFASWLQSGLSNVWPKKKEAIFLGFCSFLVVFNLVPLWPWLGVVWLIYLIKNKKQFWWLLLGTLIPTIILFILVSPIDWFRETITYNVVYAMPRLSAVKTLNDWLKIIFFPFFSLVTKGSFQAKVIGFLTIGWLVGLINLLKINRKKFLWLLTMYPLLVLANLRVLSPTLVFYLGFHLLPWLGLLLVVFLISLKEVKKLIVLIIFLVGGISLLLDKNMPYFWKTDALNEYHINYSQFNDINFAVKILAEENDRLAVLTSESLIYWNTGVAPATRQVVYYAWELDVPELKADYEKVFYGDNPPEFIYGSQEKNLVEQKYAGLLKNDKLTELYVRKDKVKNIDQSQIDNLLLRKFSLIEN
ncbi:hypothetical protein ACFL18_00435 [Patescibacteria group bacterium]